MAAITQTKSGIDAKFSHPMDEVSEFEKLLDFECLSDLPISELDEWINDYVSHLPKIPVKG